MQRAGSAWTRYLTIAVAALIALGSLAACGGGSSQADAADTATPTDATAATDTATIPDTAATTVACCPLGNCGPNEDCVSGACLPKKKAADACYFDGECPAGARCDGEVACACGAELASCAATPGACRYPTGCCNADGDCEDGGVCVAGQCRTKPASGACWRDDQCDAGAVCLGVEACACGASDCTDRPGICGLAGPCCASDAECALSGSGGVCRGGRCVAPAAALPAGSCWQDDDCADGEGCLGVSLCACAVGHADDASCAVPTTPGRCGKAAESCCTVDGDCGAGELCVGGACARAPDRSRTKDECWVDGHCGVGRVCEGARLCGCHEDGCATSTVGHCRTLAPSCAADVECPVGMRCVRPDEGYCADDPTPPGGVCVAEIETTKGQCWSTAECDGVSRCGGEEVCADGAGCDLPNRAGECMPKIKKWDCCNSHIECGDGLECRNSDASSTCPVGTGAICVPKPVFGESCWNLYDCPEGKTCQRTNICGCNGKCRWNNMGQCETPEFCDVDLDCGQDSVCAHDTECILSPCTTAATCSIGGRCQQRLEGACWSHDECGAGKYCEGLRVCPSDQTCVAPDQPGTCQPRAELGGCCTSLRGCEPGLRCVSVINRSGCSADFSAICVPAVTLGSDCYADDDCETGQRCAGATLCPCGAEDCTSPPKAGSCVPE